LAASRRHCDLDSCSRIRRSFDLCYRQIRCLRLSVCWCPDPLNYPHVIAVTKCASQASTQLRNRATPTFVFINAPRVPVRCGLLFGRRTRRLRDRGTGRAFRSMRRRGLVAYKARPSGPRPRHAAARKHLFPQHVVPFAISERPTLWQQEHMWLIACVGYTLTDER
jgi:hypothetical protein